jgi:hypothetical protein
MAFGLKERAGVASLWLRGGILAVWGLVLVITSQFLRGDVAEIAFWVSTVALAVAVLLALIFAIWGLFQKGWPNKLSALGTLLVMVVLIVGVPDPFGDQDYTLRAAVTEGLSLAAAPKVGVAEFWLEHGR